MRSDSTELEKLRSKELSPITTEQGAALARQLKAFKYLECSAKTQENLKSVFDESVRCYLKPKKKGILGLLSKDRELQISEPTNFKHVSSVFWNKHERNFVTKNIPPEFRKLYQAAAIQVGCTLSTSIDTERIGEGGFGKETKKELILHFDSSQLWKTSSSSH